MNMLVEELRKDNMKYIEIAIQKINEMLEENMINDLKDREAVIAKIQMFKSFMPIHLKTMISKTTYKEIMIIIKSRCAEKWKIIEDHKLEEKLKDLYIKIQDEINE